MAGAYLMPPGAGQIITGMAFSGSTKAFDKHGRVIPVPSYRKFELGSYLEYGLTERVTVIAAPSFDHIRASQPGSTYDGLGTSGAGLRFGLLRNPWDILSFEASFIGPGPPFSQGVGLIRARRAAGADLRLAAGHGFAVQGIPVFLEVASGYRIYGGEQPGEVHADLTLGARPSPSILVMLQSFSTIFTNKTAIWPRQSWHTLQLSLVYDFSPRWSIQGGAFMTVAGYDAGRQAGPLLAMWYRF